MGQDGKSTGKYRAKRPDLRANAKKRQAEKTKAYEAKEGVTYAAKKKAKLAAAAAGAPPEKERKFTDAGMKLKKYTDDQKLERALKKRLRQIEALVARRHAGEMLDASQLEKVARLKQVTRELRILEGKEVSDDQAGESEEEQGDASEQEEEGESDDE